MNEKELAWDITKIIFESHYKVCLQCRTCPLDDNGNPETGELMMLCSAGSLMFEQHKGTALEVERSAPRERMAP